MTKICFKCQIEKPITEFYKHRQMGDGHLNKCKECTKYDVHRYRYLNPDKVRESDRRQSLKKTSKSRKPFGLKYKAQTALNNALRDGRIIKPQACEICDEGGRIEGHHDDYTQPLNVRWLCCGCHKRVHSPYYDNKAQPLGVIA